MPGFLLTAMPQPESMDRCTTDHIHGLDGILHESEKSLVLGMSGLNLRRATACFSPEPQLGDLHCYTPLVNCLSYLLTPFLQYSGRQSKWTEDRRQICLDELIHLHWRTLSSYLQLLTGKWLVLSSVPLTHGLAGLNE